MTLTLVDIGANLTDKSFRSDRDQVIDRAVAAGVTRMIVTGTSVQASRHAAELAETRPGVLYATAGVHPHDAKSCSDNNTLALLRELAARPQVVAIGECGLDFYRDLSPRPVQRAWFEAQVELACDLAMPLFLHERDASDAMLEILRRYRRSVRAAVIHCFTGTARQLDAYLDLDLHIGITGWICDERRGRHLHDLVGKIPLDRLMIETDSPYLLPRTLSPRPKNRRNEPVYLPHVLETVARCVERSPAEVARATTATAEAFFAL
ncbi:MAG: TatD family hydrolase [Proteobacteria bacterium]|nr:TatD family hydrolase [Pseudomonadota bacterium]